MPAKQKPQDLTSMINQGAVFGEAPSLPRLFEATVASLRSNPHQPRKVFNEEKIEELAASIDESGLLQPIIVKIDPDNKRNGYIIIAGERRYRAFKRLEKLTIPAILSSGDEAELSLIENVQREDLNPIEEAAAYAHLVELHGYSQSDLVKVVGKKRRTINEIMKLNTLPEEILEEWRALGTPPLMTKTAFVAISRMKTCDEQLKLWHDAKNGQLTTRQLEEKKKGPTPISKVPPAARVINLGSQFSRQLKKLSNSDLVDNPVLSSYLLEIREQIDAMLGRA